MRKKNYKYLLFDVDDTLIDNLENVKYAFKQTLKVLNLPYSDMEFEKWRIAETKFWVKWENLIVPQEYSDSLERKICWVRSQRFITYFNISLKEAKKLNDVYISALNEIVLPIEGVFETLKKLNGLKDLGENVYKIYAATNGPSNAILPKLKKIDCDKFFSGYFSADMFGVMKPDFAFFENIKKRLNNFDNSRYLLIGDSLISDIQGAMSAGIDSCWLNPSRKKNETEWLPTYEIHDIRDILKILQKNQQLNMQ